MHLDRWFSDRPLQAQNACISLCRIALQQYPALRGIDWRKFNIRTKSDWAAWRRADFKGDIPIVTAPEIRRPPVPGMHWIFGKDHKVWPKNCCPVCHLETYSKGHWRPDAGKATWNKSWHAPCFNAHGIWRDASWAARYLARRQGGRCPITGEALLRNDILMGDVEVDHVVPLWRVRFDGAQYQWPDVLRFWGIANLQTLSNAGHKIKTAREAKERAGLKVSPAQYRMELADHYADQQAPP